MFGVAGIAQMIPVLGSAAMLAVMAPLCYWSRMAELSCDRAALLVVRDSRVVTGMLAKLAGWPGTFGDVARNSFFGPHLFNIDMSMSKSFRIRENLSGQFRVESFNTFNHVNLGQPNATVDSPTAGQITSVASLAQMRKLQFGLRLNF